MERAESTSSVGTVKQHNGSIAGTKPGEFAEIRLILPRTGALLSERQ
jgi:hypothetical protein